MSVSAQRVADWITVEAAVTRILEIVTPLPEESVSLEDALGRTLTENVTSPIDHPPWDNSAMDGFAVRAVDVRGASEATPVTLRVTEEVPAGGFATRAVSQGTAIRIMTGAPVPEGADSVVRIEHTQAIDADTVGIRDDADAGRNIRARGEDVRSGEKLFSAGRRLRPGEIGVLASIGRGRVAVHRRPRVALLATGDELVDIDAFDEVRAGRRIVNSNSYALAAAVRSAGGEPIHLGIARDSLDDVQRRVEQGLDADAIVTTAGASVGDHDVVKDALDRLGLQRSFWRVTMRPGSPVSFGVVPRRGTTPLPIFGLPGNPVSALVTFEVLVRPALRRMAGRTDVFGHTVRVRAAHRISSTAKLTHFLRVTLEADATGPPRATLTGAQGSGMLSSVARADALLIVPLGKDVLDEDEEAVALLLPSPDEGQSAPGYVGAEITN